MTNPMLTLKVSLLERTAAKSADADVRGAAVQARQLLTQFDDPATAAADRDAAKQEIDEIHQLVAASIPPKGKSFPRAGLFAIGAVAALMVLMIVWFLKQSGVAALAEIENTRPLLVITAIFSTVVFGGALLFASLFASDVGEQFTERFRHAREIFLVFSGIFGTVIGFYFGAGDSAGKQLQVVLDTQGAEVLAYVSGGTLPYQVTFTPEGGEPTTKKSSDGWAHFPATAGAGTGEVIATDSSGKMGRGRIEEQESEDAADADAGKSATPPPTSDTKPPAP